FLACEHDLGYVGHFAALVGFAEVGRALLRGVDSVERVLERLGEPGGGLTGLLRRARLLGFVQLLEQARAVDDLLPQRDDLGDRSGAAEAVDAAHRRPPIARPASRNEARR